MSIILQNVDSFFDNVEQEQNIMQPVPPNALGFITNGGMPVLFFNRDRPEQVEPGTPMFYTTEQYLQCMQAYAGTEQQRFSYGADMYHDRETVAIPAQYSDRIQFQSPGGILVPNASDVGYSQ